MKGSEVVVIEKKWRGERTRIVKGKRYNIYFLVEFSLK